MSALSDGTIRQYVDLGMLGIDPFIEANVAPDGYDVRLGYHFKRVRHLGVPIDSHNIPKDFYEDVWVEPGQALLLNPGDKVLATSLERIRLPDNILATLEGRSGMARLFVSTHVQAGLFDSLFDGEITYEVSCGLSDPILLYPGDRIAQLVFWFTNRPVEKGYGHKDRHSKYQGQVGATESRFDHDVKRLRA